jgi:hypothetical protein
MANSLEDIAEIQADHPGYEKAMGLTPGKAIKKECQWCKGGGRYECESEICRLNHPGPALKRIRQHCLECTGSSSGVYNCEGKVIGGIDGPHICYLHEYRFGTNPRRGRRTSRS